MEVAMSGEPEIEAMQAVFEALKKLEDDGSRKRVLAWVASKFGLQSAHGQVSKGTVLTAGERSLPSFQTIADLFSEVQVTTDVQRVLIAAAYLQEKDGKADLTGREINSELTHLGHGSTNITRDLNALMNRKPRLVIQTRKEGTTKQAQKKYRITTEGLKVVRDLISGTSAAFE
jgi:hypothetical protein